MNQRGWDDRELLTQCNTIAAEYGLPELKLKTLQKHRRQEQVSSIEAYNALIYSQAFGVAPEDVFVIEVVESR